MHFLNQLHTLYWVIKIYNYMNYPCKGYFIKENTRGDYQIDRGPLLPFLAGVLVTTPFIFLNKNNQTPQYYPQYMPYYPYPQQIIPPYPYY